MASILSPRFAEIRIGPNGFDLKHLYLHPILNQDTFHLQTSCFLRHDTGQPEMYLFTQPAPQGDDQAVFAHTVMAPAPSWEEGV